MIDRQRRDQAVTACCLAAAAEADRQLTAGRRGKILMDCLGVLAASFHGTAPGMAEFRAGLRQPLKHLLPPDLMLADLVDTVLISPAGHLHDDAVDLCVEHCVPRAAIDEGWSWARVSAEREERRTFEILRRLPAKEYSKARERLVKHTAGTRDRLRTVWDGLLGQLDLYEPIAGMHWAHVRGYWFGCPVCRWPMRAHECGSAFEVRCDAHGRDGVVYTHAANDRPDGRPKLAPIGVHATPVSAVPVTSEHLALTRPNWRYMTLPGLLECQLRDTAKAAGGSVVMWPHKDRYDLRIKLGDKVWKVDAKAWASVIKLGEALRETLPAEPGLVIVIPEHQSSSIELLHRMIRHQGYRVLTPAGLYSELAKAGRALSTDIGIPVWADSGSPRRRTGVLPARGQLFSMFADTSSPGGRPRWVDRCGYVKGVTPFPARASARRCESPLVSTRWAWCRSRSTVAVARVLGMMVSKPLGWMLLVTATERRS
jgi:hypothetical protein